LGGEVSASITDLKPDPSDFKDSHMNLSNHVPTAAKMILIHKTMYLQLKRH
jgi:hypothetical protein